MSETETVVIIGGGQAGSECAFALRQQQFAGRIVLVGEEPLLPYRRPPLSKTFLAGEVQAESLLIRAAATYQQQNIECRMGQRVVALDRTAKSVTLDEGTVIGYTHLVFATGGRARALPLPGGDKANVHTIRTVADVERLKADFAPGKRLVVIGGGYIGLEAAAVGIKCGLEVTVVEALPRVLARVAVPEISAFYEQAHRRRGVKFITGVGVQTLEGGERIEAVLLSDGQRLPVDVVIVGIGIIPNTELAAAAGLEVNQGIVVNAEARTADPAIFAIGDCAHHENVFFGRSLRVESVPHAMEHGRTAAAAICGKPVPYAAVPWFWSDQFDLKLQMVGLSEGFDSMVVRGDLAAESFCVFYLRDGVVLSADAVNRPQEFATAKQLVGQRMKVSEGLLRDESQPLKALLVKA
ncbi:MAG: FAD-dependent oxidoreductase [Pseudomonadota bacterium]